MRWKPPVTGRIPRRSSGNRRRFFRNLVRLKGNFFH
jgi:hypothetical protein